jgi:molybdopterin/thiamine biosynthesis adenylyltransferase
LESRYSRHGLLQGWDQQRIERATAIIVGVGALGNEVAQCLALAGIGRLILCDPDTVELSNLSRTPLFRERDIGRPKVDAAARTLADLAPQVRVSARAAAFESAVGLAELRDADLTLGCLDSRAARLELAGRCGLVRAPWIDGATGPWSGEVRPYVDPDGPCYGCGQDDAARATTDDPRSCADPGSQAPMGAAAPLSATVGAQMALLAVRFLCGLETSRDLLSFDAAAGTISPVRQARDATCPFHQPLRNVERVAVSARDTVRRLCQALGEGAQPLAWRPFQLRRECPRCGHGEASPGPIREGSCPRCEGRLRVRTTIELASAPPETPLSALGVPPREILAFRRDSQNIAFAELAGDEER